MSGRIVSLLGFVVILGMSDAVSFVRWGRTVCPQGTQAIQQGYMAGPHFNIGGTGVNHICVWDKPAFVRGMAGYQGGGTIYGTEFEKYPPQLANLFLATNVPSGELNNQDMPCVRCYSSTDSDMFLSVGRPDCGGSGYTVQYKGFLVSQHHTSARFRNEYVCLDESPEGVPGGEGDNNQAVIYPVEMMCGSIPCNPYVDGMEATCAVCTY